MRILTTGTIEGIDVDPALMRFFQSVNSGFAADTQPLRGFTKPRLHKTRGLDAGYTSAEIVTATTEQLWARHARLSTDHATEVRGRQVTFLGLKLELARRALQSCSLCAWECRVDRLAGERGRCNLSGEAYVADHFLHVAEEPPINPAYALNLQGCGLRCVACQQYPLLTVRPDRGTPLTADLWRHLDLDGARSLEFVGGNPDESIAAILAFLQGVSPDFALPIVWNTHGYCSRTTLGLLNGVVDVYLTDCKYGNDRCGEQLSGVSRYWRTVQQAISLMLAQWVPVIVRVLVLPGHVRCCHLPSVRWFGDLPNRELLSVSVLSQYAPDYRILPGRGPLGHRPTEEEVTLVRREVERLGLSPT
jgi:putative pyruvate formate lyase activating enzyme